MKSIDLFKSTLIKKTESVNKLLTLNYIVYLLNAFINSTT